MSMANRAASRISLSTYDEEVVRKTIEECREEIGGDPSCVFAFVSSDWRPHLEEFLEVVQVHGHAGLVVGCSADGLVGIGYRLSVIGYRLSVIGYRLSVIGYWLSGIRHRRRRQCSVFSVQCSVFSVQCSVFSVQCSVFSVQCSVFSVQCSVFSVQKRIDKDEMCQTFI